MKTLKFHNLIQFNLLTWIILSMILSISLPGMGQTGGRNTLLQMIDDDRSTIDAIAGYDQKIQQDILVVAKTPELLNRIEELQKRSQEQFRAIIAEYDQETQGAFYDMARYPNLISDLVSNGRPDYTKVNRIVSNYPKDIQQTANKYGRRYYDVLLRIDRLNNEIDRSFKRALEPYNSKTRESVNVLIGYPEIVSTLVDDKQFTVLLGEVYREDPSWIVYQLNQISQQLAEANREDLEAYKNQIQNDPEAYNELLEASEKFARENNETRYLDRSYNPTVEVRVINSYPYWFGYPYWYSEPYWRPRPFYYHTGFYRNNFGAVVFVGLPSFNFIHWQTHYHPTLFPHLSYNYYSYYENHYVKRYHDAHRAVPHYGFYRSVEANVINNPRVNNSRLQQIDHQRGKNIVRQPNTAEYGSARRGNTGTSRQIESSNQSQRIERNGVTTRRGNEGVSRSGINQRSDETNRSGVTTKKSESINSKNSGAGNVGRRAFNTVNPERTEGSYSRPGTRTGTTNIRKESSGITPSPVRNATERSGQGTTVNNNNSGNSRTSEAMYIRNRENVPNGTTRQRESTNYSGSQSQAREPQRSSATPEQRQQATSPAERSGRAANQERQVQQVEKTTAPQSREVRTSTRTEQKQTRKESTPSVSRTEAARESKSAPTAGSTNNSSGERGNGRRE